MYFRLANQRVLELEGRLEDLEEQQAQNQSGGDARLAAKHEEAEKLSVSLERVRRQAAESEKSLTVQGSEWVKYNLIFGKLILKIS